MYRPSLDRFDLGAVLASIALLVVGYVIYPDDVVQTAVWLTIFTISVGWMAFFLWKWLFDIEM